MSDATITRYACDADLDEAPDGLLVFYSDYAELHADLLASQEREAKLQVFKDFVHRRLDTAGIEKNPDGKHSKEGCRIGDRLDIVLDGLAASQLEVERLRGIIAHCRNELFESIENEGKLASFKAAVDMCNAVLSTPSSLDALAAHDREVEKKVLLKVASEEWAEDYYCHAARELRRMAAEREPKP